MLHTLTIRDLPEPEPGPGEVVIAVTAAAAPIVVLESIQLKEAHFL